MVGAVYFPGGSFFPDAGLERAHLAGEKGTIAPDDAKFPGTKAAAGGFIVIFRIVLWLVSAIYKFPIASIQIPHGAHNPPPIAGPSIVNVVPVPANRVTFPCGVILKTILFAFAVK